LETIGWIMPNTELGKLIEEMKMKDPAYRKK
jgi:hypothetical protein